MEVTQVRLPDGLVNGMEELVNKGIYTNKSEVVRDAVRKLILEKQVGTIKNTGDSVKEVREIRNKLSKSIQNISDLDQINALGN